jgi:hypothetical protein
LKGKESNKVRDFAILLNEKSQTSTSQKYLIEVPYMNV